jgi:metal-sulfur cluster biosynthetic enzyme
VNRPTEAAVWEALARVTDPELPVSLVDMGMIYGVDVSESGTVVVDLTFTSIGCPGMEMILEDVERAVSSLPGVERVRIEVVWSPPWTKARLTDTGRKLLAAVGLSL